MSTGAYRTEPLVSAGIICRDSCSAETPALPRPLRCPDPCGVSRCPAFPPGIAFRGREYRGVGACHPNGLAMQCLPWAVWPLRTDIRDVLGADCFAAWHMDAIESWSDQPGASGFGCDVTFQM